MHTSIVSQPGTMAKTQSTTELLFCTCIQTGSRQTIKVTTVAVADPEGSGPEDRNPSLVRSMYLKGDIRLVPSFILGWEPPHLKRLDPPPKLNFN